MKTKIKKLASIILLALFFGTYAHKQFEIEKAKKELLEKQEKIQQIQAELQKEKSLKNEKIKLEKLKKSLEELENSYKLQIWKVRCLEIKQELEVKGLNKPLNCDNDLERFATYNLQKTKQDLGL